ncbi:ABC transporter permease [Fusobacterium perfoetens]|uniref:ABC transporter permease n=1 Tax=Fusobacterium perfoetens TaxID=852 RepID=UPI00047F1B76|nr:ABC transporter permease [Fusobacterium perfoetens]MCI6152186.1 ABC transporter permease [Fusobacterium perfoetens]MDY3237923.1 ABC transporter permease [Fusobacterium perfoetens]
MLEQLKTSFKKENILKNYGIILGFFILCTIISFITPNFLTRNNIINLLRQSSIIGVIATGMTFVIISGNFDISVGKIAAIGGTIIMSLLSAGHSFIVSFGAALLAGALIGLINGFAVAIVKIPSLIATMGMVVILQGLIFVYTGGYPISFFNPVLTVIGRGSVLGVPVAVIIFFIGVIIANVILKKTIMGRRIYSVGGNEESSKLSGINTVKYKIMVFVINGITAIIGGLILVSRLSTATPTAGEGYDMDAIASVVIGGTSVNGGEGSVLRTIIGVLLMSVISNSFNLIGVNIYFQYIFKGIIILIAVGFGSFKKK